MRLSLGAGTVSAHCAYGVMAIKPSSRPRRRARAPFHSPPGPDFKIFGTVFDTRLSMSTAARELSVETSWQFKALLRSGGFFNTGEMVRLQYIDAKCYLFSRVRPQQFATLQTFRCKRLTRSKQEFLPF